MLLYVNVQDYFPFLEHNFLDEGFAIGLVYKHWEQGKFISISPGIHTWIGMQIHETKLSRNSVFRSPFQPPCTAQPKLTVSGRIASLHCTGVFRTEARRLYSENAILQFAFRLQI